MTELNARSIDAAICPICGQSNACAQVANPDSDTPCWCMSITFNVEVLQSIPVAQKGLSCVCARCAQGLAPIEPKTSIKT